MIVIAGGDLVLPDRVISDAALVIEDGRVAAIEGRAVDAAHCTIVDARGCIAVPGFVDVHVHGVDGHDTLDGPDAIANIAARLPRYGVTAFCPTTVACGPLALRQVLAAVRSARAHRPRASARVLPAHLESNFINPAYAGAQPHECLRLPAAQVSSSGASTSDETFAGVDVLEVIAGARADVGIVTIAPELEGAIELIGALAGAGHRVSLGHSGADFDTAVAAIEAGARHATHLFNRMTPMTHRDPGLAAAVLTRHEVIAELIGDGHHVHPAICRMALSMKGPEGIMMITDGTAGSGLPVGSRARLGGREIHVGPTAATLADGTLAGSTLTMDRAFANVVTMMGGSLVAAATVCATTPARALGLAGLGAIVEGAMADLVLLDRALQVVATMIAGEWVFADDAGPRRGIRATVSGPDVM